MRGSKESSLVLLMQQPANIIHKATANSIYLDT